MNRFALFLCVQLVMAGLAAKTTQLTSARELFEALKRGEPVRMVVHYGKCRLITSHETEAIAPDAVGGMAIGAFEYFAPGAINNKKGFVAFSENTLIEHRQYGHVINYVRVRVYDDGAVLITAQYLKPATYELLLNESYSSSLHDGHNEKSAAYFYRDR